MESPEDSKDDDHAVALLGNLSLVFTLRNDPNFSHGRGDGILSDALDEVLVKHITHLYAQHRALHNLPPVSSKASAEEAKITIRQDVTKSPDAVAQTRSIPVPDDHLLAWSWLYHHYVRPELNISASSFAAIAGMSERHLRRCRDRAISLLMRSLKQAEAEALKANRRVKLMLNLPIPAAQRLYGRQEQFARATAALLDESRRRILITGPTASGKTVFANELVRRLLTLDSSLDVLCWVYDPRTLADLYAQLVHVLTSSGVADHNPSMREFRAFLLQHRALIVVDGIDALPDSALSTLHSDLGAARLIVTTQHRALLHSEFTRIFMDDLTEQDIEAFIQDVDTVDPVDRAPLARILKQDFGGNPYAVKLALNTYAEGDEAAQVRSEEILHRLFDRVMNRLGISAQRVWCACALVAPEGITIAALSRIWPSEDFGQIAVLRSHMLLRQDGDHVILETAARKYIQAMAEQRGSHVQMLVRELLNSLLQTVEDQEPTALTLIEFAIPSGWPPLPANMLHKWFRRVLEDGQGHSQRTFDAMLTLHGAHLLTEPLGLLAFGIALRRRGQWQQAEQVLMMAVSAAGNQGAFELHPQMFLELGILLAQAGRYQFAGQMFDDALRMARHYGTTKTLHVVRLEYAQLWVNRGDGDHALMQLAELPESWRALALQAESYLLLDDPRRSLDLAFRAVKLLQRDVFNLCRIQVLIGRAYLALGNARLAEAYLKAALTAFDAQGDIYAQARAQTNLALLYLQQEKVNSAEALLQQAKMTQLALGDHAGLLITQHNLEELNRYKN